MLNSAESRVSSELIPGPPSRKAATLMSLLMLVKPFVELFMLRGAFKRDTSAILFTAGGWFVARPPAFDDKFNLQVVFLGFEVTGQG